MIYFFFQILCLKFQKFFSKKVRIILETKYHYSSNGPPCFIQSFLAKSWHFDRKGPMVRSGPDRVEKFLALDQEDSWRGLSFSQNWAGISLSNFNTPSNSKIICAQNVGTKVVFGMILFSEKKAMLKIWEKNPGCRLEVTC